MTFFCFPRCFSCHSYGFPLFHLLLLFACFRFSHELRNEVVEELMLS
jgi:hypothetical protein